MTPRNPSAWLDSLHQNMSKLMANTPAADIERNAKAMLSSAFTKLDLVTREEFDIQSELLARTRSKVDLLESQLRELEAKIQALESK